MPITPFHFGPGAALQGVVSQATLHWACIAAGVCALLWIGLRRTD